MLFEIGTRIGALFNPVFPYAVSFSGEGDMNLAILGFPGNAVYSQYYWNDGLIGSMPEFSK